MRILGIDPGYGIVGWGIIDTNATLDVIDYGVVSTPKELTLPERLEVIYSSIESLILSYKPDVVAIEELFYFRNQTTVIPVAEARGAILLSCRKNGVPIYEYTPLQIKQALTGVGRAEKQQVQFMVKSILLQLRAFKVWLCAGFMVRLASPLPLLLPPKCFPALFPPCDAIRPPLLRLLALWLLPELLPPPPPPPPQEKEERLSNIIEA